MADPKLEFEISGNLTVDAIYMPEGIKIGDASSGEINQSNNAIAIGFQAGFQDQSSNAIAIGNNAGFLRQNEKAIAIGEDSGQTNQDKFSVAIGRRAGKDNQKEGAVALGYNAGVINQGLKSIAIGFGAGRNDQSNNSIAIGNNAGKDNLGDKSIAIGWEAEIDNSSANVTQNVIVLNATNSPFNSDASSAFFVKPLRDISNVVTPTGTVRNDFKVMVYDDSRGEIAYDSSYNGTSTGGGGGTPAPPPYSVQFNNSGSFGGDGDFRFISGTKQLDLSNGVITMPAGIRIGDASSGALGQYATAIAIGNSAGFEGQNELAIAMGKNAGKTDQSNNAIAIGNSAGFEGQNEKAIAIGLSAGRTNQDKFSIAIGKSAGHTDQNKEAVAIGYNAGEINQGLKAVALGNGAGRFDQSNNSIAIGNNAGQTKLGQKSIAIGFEAEIDNSSANVTQNVIVLNATNSPFNSDASSAFFVKPLRDLSNNGSRGNFRVMIYDETRGEIGFDSSYNGTGGGGGGGTPSLPHNSIQFNNSGSFGGDGDFTFISGTNQLDLSNGVITMPAGIRIGDVSSGLSGQSATAIAIGWQAAQSNQGSNSIAIGRQAGQINQGFDSIAIGLQAGDISQGNTSVAIGPGAGFSNQSKDTIAIGVEAGKEFIGEKSIAIGYQAEYDNRIIRTQNVIVLNATDSSLNSDVSSAFFVKPLRDVSNNVAPATNRNQFKVVVYDPSRGEIAYDASYNGTSNIDLTNVNAVSVSAETITLSESLFLGSITYEDASLSQVSGTPTQITLNTPVILFDISNNSNNYYTDISNQGQSGQTLDIFMETNGGTVKVDFGTNKLVTGGGTFRYLTFNSTGQSASLIYVGSKWRIRNSGALPSAS
jgi:hypothetical protein